MIYAPTMSRGMAMSRPITVDEDKELEILRKFAGSQDPYLFEMRAAAYTCILFTHSLQNFSYNVSLNRPIDFLEYGPERPYVISNIMLPAVDAGKADFLARDPKRNVFAMSDDESEIAQAEYVDRLIDWAAEYHGIESVMRDAADLFYETGNVFFFVGWDPSGGRRIPTADGSVMFEGDPVVRAESMFSWALHPQAKNYKESPLAHHVGLVPRDWVRDNFPEMLEFLPERSVISSIHHGVAIERALLNMSSTHGDMWSSSSMLDLPDGDEHVEWHTIYYRSSSRYENGKMICGPGVGGIPVKVAFSGENPYIDWSTGRRTLPIVHLRDVTVPGRALGEPRILHAIPQQIYINETRGQIKANAELLGNPQLTYEQDGIDPSQITNEHGGHIPRMRGAMPPEYVKPPSLPEYVYEGEQAAFKILDLLFSTQGPSSSDVQANVRSAVHQMVLEEQKQHRLAPTIRSKELAMEEMWNLYAWNWRTFGTWPRQIGTLGSAQRWNAMFFSGEMVPKSITVKMEPYSGMPVSRAAVVSEWDLYIKSGAAPVQVDDNLNRQFWHDVGKPSLARTRRDNSADIDKAFRNIQKTRAGMVLAAEPQDNADAHLAVYTNWMKSPEYEQAKETDPMLEFRLNVLVSSFVAVKQEEMYLQQLRAAQMMALEAGSKAQAQEFLTPQEARTQGAARGQRPGNGSGDGGVSRGTRGIPSVASNRRETPK